MEHRFDQEWSPKRCMVCDLEVLGGPYPSQCPGPTAQRFIRELLAQRPTLVQIDEDLWINPAHVVCVEFYAKDSMTAADDPRVVIKQVGSSHAIRDKSLAEVVALINGGS